MADYFLALKERAEIAEGTMAFWFDTSGTDYTFRAGQNADFTLIDPPQTDAEGNTRTFSFASSPSHSGSFMIATRMRRTAFKNSLKELPLGAKLKVSPALGSFTLHKDISRPAVFLTGGIGITPMRSIIEWATLAKLPHKLLLLYSNRTPQTTAFLSDLETWTKQNPNFKLVATVTDMQDPKWRNEHGRIDGTMLRKHVTDLMKPIYYLAGPPEMVSAMRRLLEAAEVSEDYIKTEEFAGY
ncbi:MAG: FAD-dependent oxidoreductase [Acidobacteriia bacterium]|nr:FAD-dependent oxidoreductase [Terriglobia bacterium]